MQLNGYRMMGGFCVVTALVGYAWWMATQVVPVALELATALGLTVSGPSAWVVLTALAVLISLGVGRVTR